MKTQPISYRDGDTPLTGFLAWDDTRSGKRPGILVVHGAAGLDDHARNRARRIAEIGFLAFACDRFGDGVAGERQRGTARIGELRGDAASLGHPGVAYHGPSDARAWAATQAFFAELFGPHQGPVAR